ncbi:MAG TPA: hypothetical protein VJ717_02835 [Gemmatimonadaceae bacterium]|nr:hypothetical protein [Gemmatimonadaceae bacterium]
MRIVRTVVVAGLVIAAVPAVALAQSANSFDNGWFWGAKGGITQFDAIDTQSGGIKTVSATTVGGEWLITRSRGALMLSVEQSFFDEVSAVFDPTQPGASRAVDISDMRRYHMGLMAYPVSWGGARPYLGVGYAINVIQEASPRGTFTSEGSMDSVFTRVDQQSSRASFVITAGIQAQAGPIALFAQAAAMPTRDNFLINASSNTFLFEAGIRFRISDAIEKW